MPNLSNIDDWEYRAWLDSQQEYAAMNQGEPQGRTNRKTWFWRGHSRFASEPTQEYHPDLYGSIGYMPPQPPPRRRQLPAPLRWAQYNPLEHEGNVYGLEYVMKPEARSRFGQQPGFFEETEEQIAQPKDYTGVGPKNYRRSDARILEHVCDLLAIHPELDASKLEVSVNDGVVTLQGEVQDKQMRRMAEDIADDVVGVTYVDNLLRIPRRS